MQIVKLQGKPFSGITYNQGVFTGNRGHIFIKGHQQCTYGLNIQSANRIFQAINTILDLENAIKLDNICKQCHKKVSLAIANRKETTNVK
jgi:hypothetical protein